MTTLLTVKEAHARLRIGQTNFRKLVKDGKIPRIQIGKKLLFEEIWIEDFIHRNTRPARAPFVSSHHSRLTIKDKENIGA